MNEKKIYYPNCTNCPKCGKCHCFISECQGYNESESTNKQIKQ